MQRSQRGNETGRQPVLDGQRLDPDTTFKRLLDAELEKVCSFYRLKEIEIFRELEQLQADLEEYKHETAGVDMDEVVDIEQRRRYNRSNSVFAGVNVPFKRRRRASTMSMSIEEENDDSDSDADDNAALMKKAKKDVSPTLKQRSKSVANTHVNSDREMEASRESLTTPASSILKRRPSMALEMEASRAATGMLEVLAMRQVRFMIGSLRPSTSIVS